MIHRIIHISLALLGATVIALAGGAPASGADVACPPRHPFQPGERLEYRLRWTVIPAGHATLEVHPMTDVNGQPAYHFRLTARSNAFVDSLYKVRDKIDAFSDADMTRSVRYLKKQHEGTTRRNEQVEFDWDAQTMRYTNSENADQLTAVMPGSFDPLSAFYYVRCHSLTPTFTLARPVTDGKKNVIGRLRIVKRETISVNGKKYDTLLVEPDLTHIKGVFEQSKDATLQLWLTADHRRIPVRVRSKVVVGSFVGELMTASGLTETPATEPPPPPVDTTEAKNAANGKPALTYQPEKSQPPAGGTTQPKQP